MTHYLSDRLPELNGEPLSSMLLECKRLDSYEHELRELVVKYILMKLGRGFGKLNFYGSSKSEHDIIRDSWISGLCDLTIPAIMNGVYYILVGKTDYVDSPPTSPIGFHKICLNHRNYAKFPQADPTSFAQLTHDQEASKKKSESIARIHMHLIQKSGAMVPKFLKGKLKTKIILTPEELEMLSAEEAKVKRYTAEIKEFGHVVS